MIKTAVIGASGFVGRHLLASYRARFPDCVGTGLSSKDPSLTRFDIRQPVLSALRLEESAHQAVLIAAAKPNITYCEQNPGAAYEVNVRGTLELARQAGRAGLSLIFLSSDYVFDGHRGPYADDHATAPATVYGQHKAEVERELPSLGSDYLILRLSKIYGLGKGDGTLLDEMAQQLAARREIRAARDQVFCPTYVADLVAAVHAIQAKKLRGTCNACNPERWSRLDIALSLAVAMGADRSLVKPIALHDLAAMAGRPLDTSMSIPRLSREVQPRFVPLREHFAAVARLRRAAG